MAQHRAQKTSRANDRLALACQARRKSASARVQPNRRAGSSPASCRRRSQIRTSAAASALSPHSASLRAASRASTRPPWAKAAATWLSASASAAQAGSSRYARAWGAASPFTRKAQKAASRLVPAASASSRARSSRGRGRKGTIRQRERRVDSTAVGWSVVNTNTTKAGGSSTDLRRALAACGVRRSMSNHRTTLRDPSWGRRGSAASTRRTVSMPCPSGTSRSGWVRAATCRQAVHVPHGAPSRGWRQSKAAAAACAASRCPAPGGPARR